MNTIDLAFPLLTTKSIPADHGYHLYSALAHVVQDLHGRNGIAVHPIRGTQLGNRELTLNSRSRLVLRTDSDSIGQLIGHADESLNLARANQRIELTRPE